MSKMATLRRMRGVSMGDPSILSFLGKAAKGLGKVAGGVLGLGGGSMKLDLSGLTKGLGLTATKGGLVDQLTGGQMGPASLAFPGERRRRRGKGISATELRGFRKVAGLLRKVGMVPKATRRKVR